MYEIIKSAGAAGIEGWALMDRLYQDDPTGGPESTNILSVMRGHINAKLAPWQLVIKGRSGPGGFFRLDKLNVV